MFIVSVAFRPNGGGFYIKLKNEKNPPNTETWRFFTRSSTTEHVFELFFSPDAVQPHLKCAYKWRLYKSIGIHLKDVLMDFYYYTIAEIMLPGLRSTRPANSSSIRASENTDVGDLNSRAKSSTNFCGFNIIRNRDNLI